MIFSYQAKDREGRTVTGSLDAPDERLAAQEIRDMGYFPMRLSEKQGAVATFAPEAAGYGSSDGTRLAAPLPPMSPGRWFLIHVVYAFWSGVGLRDLALMYRQFAAMLGAGVPIYQALTTLMRQTGNSVLRRCLQKISARVQEGEMLTGAMAEFPWIFTRFHQAMIKAGEISGRLDVMLNRLAAALEQEYALRSVIKKETFYPVTTLLMAFLLPPLVYVVVFHNFKLYYTEALQPLLIFGLFLVGGFVVTRLLSQFKAAYDWLIATLPAIGGAVRMVALARFARALSALWAAGVAIPDALRAAAAATGNAYMEKRMVSAVPALQGGVGITEALLATRIFPPMVISMLGTGEQTGSLDVTMDKVAEYYEQEAAIRLHTLSVSLGVIALIVAGIKVLLVMIKFYTGYFNDLNDMAQP